LGIVPWRKGEATDAAQFALGQWLSVRGGTGPAEIMSAIRQVRLFIEKHGDGRFQSVEDPTAIISNRAGWRQGQGEQREWLIPPEVWKSEVCAGLEPVMVAKALADHGMLAKASDGYQKNHRIEGRQMRLYTITARILAGLGDESGVADVAGVESSLSEGAIKAKKPTDLNAVTGATPATSKNHSETDIDIPQGRAINGRRHRCAQCGKDGDVLEFYSGTPTPTWLHWACASIWQVASESAPQ
jgi:hypothetical protein